MARLPDHAPVLPPWPAFRFATRLTSVLRRALESSQPAEVRILELASGYFATKALRAAVVHRIPDRLVDGARSATEIANELELDPDAIARLLRFLAEHGVLDRARGDCYSLNSVSRLLVAEHPRSLAPVADLFGGEFFDAWARIEDRFATDKVPFETVHGVPIFDYLAAHPDRGRVFDAAMAAVSASANVAIAADYDFSSFEQLVDVGGGNGSMLSAIAESCPDLGGILFDSEAVLNDAFRRRWAEGPLAGRIELHAGNFFDAVPRGGDAYLLKQIVHDWSDPEVCRIYASIRAAIRPDGRLLLAEFVIEEGDPLRRSKLGLDVHMLALLTGRERTREEHGALLAQTGFELTRIVPTRSPVSIVEAEPC